MPTSGLTNDADNPILRSAKILYQHKFSYYVQSLVLRNDENSMILPMNHLQCSHKTPLQSTSQHHDNKKRLLDVIPTITA